MSAKLLGWVPVLLLGGLLLGVPSSTRAEDKKEDKEDTAADLVEEITNAYKLAEFGRKNNAPEALIAAGSMLRSVKFAKLKKITEKPEFGDDKSEEVKAKGFEEQANELFDEATRIALKKGIKGVDAMVKAARDREYRDVIGGPRNINRTIGARATHVFNIDVYPNAPSSFGFRGDFPMKVSIVRSDNDNVIAAGITAAGNVRHYFGGSATGRVRVTIRIQNVGNQAGSYSLYAS